MAENPTGEAETGGMPPSGPTPPPAGPTEPLDRWPDDDAPTAFLFKGSDDLAAYGHPQIHGFRIIRIVASGGMGTVYEAEQIHPPRTVALKVIRPEMATAEMIRRFQFEAEALARLEHPGIARIYEAGVWNHSTGTEPFIAMEFIHGLPLHEYARTVKLPLRARVELLVKICEAVQHAHVHGIIHRDLKPGNILIEASGQPKVVDFGLARSVGGPAGDHDMRTLTGQILGTIRYMSPEQADGRHRELDARSDVYSLGVLAYELLTERHPQGIEGRTAIQVLRAVRREDPVPIGVRDKALRGDIEVILDKALEKDKARRYQNAGELGDDLRRYLEDEPILARPPGLIYEARKFIRRNQIFIAAVFALFFILLVSLGIAVEAARYAIGRSARLAMADRVPEISKRIASSLSLQQAQLAALAKTAGDDIEVLRSAALSQGPVQAVMLLRGPNDFDAVAVDPKAGDAAGLLRANAAALERLISNGPIPPKGTFEDFLPTGSTAASGEGRMIFASRAASGTAVFLLDGDYFVTQIRSATFGQTDAVQIYSGRGYMLTTTGGPPGVLDSVRENLKMDATPESGEFDLRTQEFSRDSWHMVGYSLVRRLQEAAPAKGGGIPWHAVVSYDMEFVIQAQKPLIWFSAFTIAVWPLLIIGIAGFISRRRMLRRRNAQ